MPAHVKALGVSLFPDSGLWHRLALRPNLRIVSILKFLVRASVQDSLVGDAAMAL